jgi:Transposase, Mutator family
VEMYARGLSTRDIEAVFADVDGRSLLSRTAVSEITERLWAEYEAFASRDLSEFAVTYQFVDGIAERDGAPGMIRAIEECLPRSIRQRCLDLRRRAQDEKSTKQDARRRLAGVQGARRGLLPGGLASIGAPAARRHRGDLRQGPALGGGVSRRRL